MLALLDTYRVLLTHPSMNGGDQVQMFPVQDDIIFSYERDKDNRFYRRKIKNELLLRGDDFQSIMEIETGDIELRCDPISVEVYNIPNDQTVFLGLAYLFNAKFDLDRCEVSISVESIDDTTPFVKGWDREINLLDGTDKTTIYTNFQDVPTDPISTIETTTTSETISDPTSIDDFTNSGFPSASDGWVMIQDDVTVSSYSSPTSFDATRKTIWAREIADASYDDGPAPPGDESPGSWYKVEISGLSWRWAREIYAFERTGLTTSTGYTAGAGLGVTTFYAYHKEFDWLPYHVPVIDNGVALEEALSALLDGTGLTLKSNYFDINADAFTPGDLPYDEIRYGRIVVFQKTDIKLPDATDNATQLLTSRKSFFEQLAALYQAYAVVIGSELRLEHISYWEGLQGIDFTAGDYDPALDGRQKYSYDNADVETKITFRQLDMDYRYISKVNDTSLMFGTFSWNVATLTNCQEGAIERQVYADQCTNDMQMLHAVPGNFTDSGMCFVACFLYEGQYIVEASLSANRLNILNSPNILGYYHFRHNLPGQQFEQLPQFGIGITPIANPVYDAESIRKRKRQEQISVPLNNVFDFEPYKMQKSQFGWGLVDSAEYSLRNCILKLNLLHDTY